ncbi:hypothetical protein O181_006516 [Austropuccinia psidii MF-1]|uniref:Uncharacterized protein n=1 Tax=Austropuccinia psidii MF-1 TaxID=1389203 RepID=A0A9Q3BJA1_9BASI|nr:hypothetical protein [Austropuccinia psidii MF-1]
MPLSTRDTTAFLMPNTKESNRSSPEFIKGNAFGMSTLSSTLSEELQPVLLQKYYFLKSLEALSKACGQNSIVILCQRLFELFNLTYDQITSLASHHAYKLKDIYCSFQNCASGNSFQMDIGEDAGIQTSPSHATPTRFNHGSNLEETFKAFLSKYMKEYLTNTHSENQAEEDNTESKVTEELAEDDNRFYLQEDIHDQMQLMSLSSENKIKLIHDSGASQSTVFNFSPLTDPHPTKVIMRTFSGVVEITLMGKLNLGAYILYPVYYAPQVQSDSISAYQFEDHGLRSYQKNQCIIVKSGNQIFQTFPRKGNLYMSKCHHSSSLIYEEHPISVIRDWTVIPGHPSNEYLKQFLQHNCLKQSFPLNCSMCKSCKLKATPHNHPKPTSNLPFQKLHFDILEKKPLAQNSI